MGSEGSGAPPAGEDTPRGSPGRPQASDGDVAALRAERDHHRAVAERTTMELAEARREAAERGEAYVAVVGHDLRNPLAAIVNTAELVRMLGGPSAERIADRIQRASARLTRMVDQALDVARLGAGSGLPLSPSPGDVATLCTGAIDGVRATRPEAVIEVASEGATGARFDPERLGAVVAQLVGNALDHGSPDCPVRVIVAGDGARVRVAVHNDGAIDDQVAHHLLDPLGRGRRKGARPAALGLGTYVSRCVIEAHGGSLAVAGDQAAGTTTATIELPVAGPG